MKPRGRGNQKPKVGTFSRQTPISAHLPQGVRAHAVHSLCSRGPRLPLPKHLPTRSENQLQKTLNGLTDGGGTATLAGTSQAFHRNSSKPNANDSRFGAWCSSCRALLQWKLVSSTITCMSCPCLSGGPPALPRQTPAASGSRRRPSLRLTFTSDATAARWAQPCPSTPKVSAWLQPWQGAPARCGNGTWMKWDVGGRGSYTGLASSANLTDQPCLRLCSFLHALLVPSRTHPTVEGVPSVFRSLDQFSLIFDSRCQENGKQRDLASRPRVLVSPPCLER